MATNPATSAPSRNTSSNEPPSLAPGERQGQHTVADPPAGERRVLVEAAVAIGDDPLADAGDDQTVLVGTTVQLDGAGSADVDADPLTYLWSLVTVPPESTATLSDPMIVNPTFDADLAGLGNSGIAGNAGNLNPQNPQEIDGTAAQAFGGVFSLAINTGSFTAFIELLKTQGNVQVLSSPRVATVNNQKAVIKVGQDEFFVTDISTTPVTSSAETSSASDITLTPFFSGIALDVTPQIDNRGGVTLHVHPSVSEVLDQTKNFVVDGRVQSLPLAQSRVRESDSIIYANSGQIVVIGGLMQQITGEELAATPVLGDVPFFGTAFRQTKQVSSKTELVILLKPLVVEGPGGWSDPIAQSTRQLEQLDRGFHVGGKTEIFGTEAERQ